MSLPGNGTLMLPTGGGAAQFEGRFAVASVREGKVAWTFVEPAAP